MTAGALRQEDGCGVVYASVRRRSLATCFDYGLYFVFSLLYIATYGEVNSAGTREVQGVMTLPVLFVWMIYFVVVEAVSGATLGHHILGLKVQSVTRKKTGWRHSVKRRIVDPIDFMFFGLPAYIAVANSTERQRLGDMFANTIVIRNKEIEERG